MAVTSLWRVKGYIGKVLLYAENPDKTTSPETIPSPAGVNRDTLEDVIAYAGREEATNQRQLVTGINCNAGTARSEMMAVKKRFRKEDGTIAYHGYQSFREGEVTPEQAHRIGIRLAEELWGSRYQVLVATHLDKASHIHSHFVINTVSFVDGKKFYRSNGDYARMREASDRLCREYGLSVIRRPEGKGKNYSEWSAEKNGKPTNRSQIRADIDRAIGGALTENEFFDALEEMGYELKLTAASGKALQRPSLRPQGSERFYRFDRLGEEYTLDAIESRILERIRRQEPFPEEEQRRYRKYRTEHPPHTKAKGIAALYYGVPYIDEGCAPGLSNNIVIYGHHMNDGTMFADLCGYADRGFYEGHKTIRFDTLSGFGEYEVVATFRFNTNRDTFRYNEYTNMDEAEFAEFLENVRARALYDTDMEVEYGDTLLTLSTCEYTYKNGRFVVVAKKVG